LQQQLAQQYKSIREDFVTILAVEGNLIPTSGSKLGPGDRTLLGYLQTMTKDAGDAFGGR
jgi:hypothetical protein